MPKRVKRYEDPNVWAAAVVAQTTGQPTPDPMALLEEVLVRQAVKKGKNPAAVALGRLGGVKGGKARAAVLTPGERSAIAKKAAQKRWKAKRDAEMLALMRDGKTNREIAKQLGIEVSQVRTLIDQAKKNVLRQREPVSR